MMARPETFSTSVGSMGRPANGRSPSASFVELSSVVALGVLAAAMCLLEQTAGPLPMPAPERYVTHYRASSEGKSTLHTFTTPLVFARYLKGHSRRVRCVDPVSYALEFRRSFDEFARQGWKGDCNDFANVMAEVGSRHGYPMGIVSLWPRRWQDRLTRDWHQIAVLCLEANREYLIFEFEEVIHWQGTLDEYAELMGKRILPIGGELRWRATRPNPLARFLDHLRANEVLEENHLPLRPVPRRPVA